ncbi:hypothetical protein BpHYR1_051744 [Brachionus plicatilis]|uniref:Uncharacterized protein n=1 Tax=Brachionus plicatilis TaxID=10195 RepID=A0A3M7SZK7_BRAPC|nr:hypothetical protein BpHYR1_051744 [Brachionus plicatilis]
MRMSFDSGLQSVVPPFKVIMFILYFFSSTKSQLGVPSFLLREDLIKFRPSFKFKFKSPNKHDKSSIIYLI